MARSWPSEGGPDSGLESNTARQMWLWEGRLSTHDVITTEGWSERRLDSPSDRWWGYRQLIREPNP